MTRDEIVNAAMAIDLEAEQAADLLSYTRLMQASWAHKVAYLMLMGRADLLPTSEDVGMA